VDDTIRLNRYIANAGVCSRREADVLITAGAITVNGKVITELGTKIHPGDTVLYGKQRLVNEKKVYVLLNKPKDYITTSDDPQERKTVLELVQNACRERIYPVGRLDRNTTGLLLLTNDGEMTKRLTHPKHGVKKLYHVQLDKKVTRSDLEKIAEGVRLDDTVVVPDQVAWAGPEGQKNEVGIELHSGQNRVVRRIFEQLGYQVVKLDRVSFAGLTKKDLPRGKWRHLTEKEISFLKML
jgi:23S rRNA pseudouridine2605 synthase